jgi:hypothetical protein
MRELLPQLTQESRDEIMQRLMPALNDGRVALQTPEPF